MPDRLLMFLIGVMVATLVLATRLAAQNPPAGQRPDTAAHPTTDQRYRYRILGIYDQKSGEPVPDVEVSDVLSGLSSRTTRTGTVSLLFLPEGGSLVRMRKVGYEIQTVPVSISPADTAPVTMLIRRAATLEAVVVKDSASKYLSSAMRGAEEGMKSHSGVAWSPKRS